MDTKMHTSENRLFFFDNLRYLMVLFVLIFHSAASYTSIVRFWPYHDPNPSELMDHLTPLLDVFMISILFFIAGYFALPSLLKRGSRNFLAGKFRRLGIPLLVVTILALPVLDYIHYYTQSKGKGLVPRNYMAHWWLSLKRITEFRFGRLKMTTYLDMTEQFYQRYMWFLSLLLLFFIIFCLLYEAWKKWGWHTPKPSQTENVSKVSVYRALAWVGLSNIVFFALAKYLLSSTTDPFDMGWFSLGNLIQFEFAKVAFYLPFFGLGIYAYSRKWFTNGVDFGRPWIWGIICLVLMVGGMLSGRGLSRTDAPSIGLQAAFLVCYPLWTLSFLGLFTAFAYRRWHNASPFDKELADNSYNMYLAHYVFVMTIPLLLSAWVSGPVWAKFTIVVLVTLLLSYGISKYVIQKFPRMLIIGLLGVNILLALFTFR